MCNDLRRAIVESVGTERAPTAKTVQDWAKDQPGLFPVGIPVGCVAELENVGHSRPIGSCAERCVGCGRLQQRARLRAHAGVLVQQHTAGHDAPAVDELSHTSHVRNAMQCNAMRRANARQRAGRGCLRDEKHVPAVQCEVLIVEARTLVVTQQGAHFGRFRRDRSRGVQLPLNLHSHATACQRSAPV